MINRKNTAVNTTALTTTILIRDMVYTRVGNTWVQSRRADQSNVSQVNPEIESFLEAIEEIGGGE